MRLCQASVLVLMACARAPATVPRAERVDAVEPVEPTEPVERDRGGEPSWSPGMTPPDNTAEALVAAAPHIRRIELFELHTMEPLGDLDTMWVKRFRDALLESEVQEGISMQSVWPVVLVVHSNTREHPIVALFVGLTLRVKPDDAWTERIVDDEGDIDWRIREVYVELAGELQLDHVLFPFIPSGWVEDRGMWTRSP
jgi:hypothetical protein